MVTSLAYSMCLQESSSITLQKCSTTVHNGNTPMDPRKQTNNQLIYTPFHFRDPDVAMNLLKSELSTTEECGSCPYAISWNFSANAPCTLGSDEYRWKTSVSICKTSGYLFMTHQHSVLGQQACTIKAALTSR